jgi:hypothetical protein
MTTEPSLLSYALNPLFPPKNILGLEPFYFGLIEFLRLFFKLGEDLKDLAGPGLGG